ncbi:alpha/beta hydrolase fold-domain-containing protein [Aspergillus carlsbadensis]|nr:alpha/beta hydrolase fold-domain-containing protein [Aspergillus carlsbadensis]
MSSAQFSAEWEPVAEAQRRKDDLTRKAIQLPIDTFRDLPYRAPPLPESCPVQGQDICITEETVPVRDGTNIRIRVYRPLSPITSGLLFLNAHGGGFVVGEPQTEEGQNRILTKSTNSVTVSVDYRKAPEFPHPYAVNDCFDVLLWCRANATSLHIDPERIVVVGGSAGANLAAVLALKCRDENVSGVIGQILNIPVTCHPTFHPSAKYHLASYVENESAPVLSSSLMRWFWQQCLPEPTADPSASPLLAKSHEELPKALIQVAGCDPLRDEGIAYARALQEGGVSVDLRVFHGLPHAFYIHPGLPCTNTYFSNMVDWVKANFV